VAVSRLYLDFATVRGHREQGDNPARWKGHLKEALPAAKKVRKVKHHAALPYADIATFMTSLRERGGGAAAALEFAILSAAGTGEVISASWPEFDLKARVWTVPAERMKGRVEHRVPLSEPALSVLRRMAKQKVNEVVFCGQKAGRALSNMALLMMLRRMERDDLTAHGFRSTFRDWAAECTNFPSEVVEMALAHVVSDKTEAAYRRGDLFGKRRALMDAWAAYCADHRGSK
jgi:integrase